MCVCVFETARCFNFEVNSDLGHRVVYTNVLRSCNDGAYLIIVTEDINEMYAVVMGAHN